MAVVAPCNCYLSSFHNCRKQPHMSPIFYGTYECHTVLGKYFQMFSKLGVILLLEKGANYGKKEKQAIPPLK
jgi:hypothetical protein